PREAVLDGPPREAVLREGAAVRVDVPRQAVGVEPFDDRPEAWVDRRLAAGDDRPPEAAALQERRAPEQRLGGMAEERRLPGVAAHRAVVVALLAEPEECRAVGGDGLLVGDLLLEEAGRRRARNLLARRRHDELRSAR